MYQFHWNNEPNNFLDHLYSNAQAAPTKIVMGGVWKGFDDNNANWGTNRVMAEQCGQVLLFTAAKAAAAGYSTSNQLPFVMFPTWNDYEEGTEVETGVDNCYRPSASITGDTLNWALNPTDATYASTTTIHHWTVYYGDSSGNLYLAQDNLARGTTSLNLATVVPAGTWNIYVNMVGMPLIMNRMSMYRKIKNQNRW